MNTAVASSSTGNAPDPEHRVRHRRRLGQAAAWPSSARAAPGGRRNAGPVPASPAANSAYIGVTVGPVTPTLQQQDHLTPSSGALVLSVQPGSPAEKAALQVNDVIVSLNGTTIQSPADLTAAIHPLKPGDQVPLGIYRGSDRMTVRRHARGPPGRRVGSPRAAIPGGPTAMTPVTDEPMLPDENEEPLPPVGHVRVVYLGPVAPHWEVRSDFGDPALIEEFRRRTMARLVLLPPHDPQYRRNRERVIRDAERENILLEWDLGVPEEEAVAGSEPAEAAPQRPPRPPRTVSRPTGPRRVSPPDGSSSSGRLIRSSHRPGASTSDGVGKVAGRGPQAADRRRRPAPAPR